MATVKLQYAATSNISFHGVWDTGVEREEWNEMSEEERDGFYEEAVFSLIDIAEVEEDE
jgi:hypothetical protein